MGIFLFEEMQKNFAGLGPFGRGVAGGQRQQAKRFQPWSEEVCSRAGVVARGLI